MNQATLQSHVDRQLDKGGITSIVVAMESDDGRMALAAAAGTADPSAGTPMTVDTPYFIASVTKMFTAAVILKLHSDGTVSLDDPISTYLPAPLLDGIHVYRGTAYADQIRVYQLLNQTSGLPDYFEGRPAGGQSLFDDLKQGRDRALELEQMLAIVRTLSPEFIPGARAQYSDTNYQLLGAMIESVTGRSLAEAYQDMIFTPLRLSHTYLFDATTPPGDRPAAAIYFKDRRLHIPNFMSSSGPDGGLVSTASEQLVFLRAFFDGKLFDPALFGRMTTEWNRLFFPIQYGYGIMRIKLPRILSPFRAPPEFLGHSGSTGSFAYREPEKGIYLAGTLNQIDAPRRPVQFMMQLANAVK